VFRSHLQPSSRPKELYTKTQISRPWRWLLGREDGCRMQMWSYWSKHGCKCDRSF